MMATRQCLAVRRDLAQVSLRGWWRVGLEVWETSRGKLLHTGWINKVLLYSTGYYIQYPVISHKGKKYEKQYSLYN